MMPSYHQTEGERRVEVGAQRPVVVGSRWPPMIHHNAAHHSSSSGTPTRMTIHSPQFSRRRSRNQHVQPEFLLCPPDPASPLGTVVMRFWHLPLDYLLKERKSRCRGWSTCDWEEAYAHFFAYCTNHGVTPEEILLYTPDGQPFAAYLVRIRADGFRRFCEQGRRCGFRVEQAHLTTLPSEAPCALRSLPQHGRLEEDASCRSTS